MENIQTIDKNFNVVTKLDKTDIEYYDIEKEPFKIYGIFRDGDCFRRIPQNIAPLISESVGVLSTHAAGGRVRFKTNSPYISIIVEYNLTAKMSHFALSGSIGCDLYKEVENKEHFINTFMPPFEIDNYYEQIIQGLEEKISSYTINLPLYSSVSKFYVGIKKGSVLEKCNDYNYEEKPIVYYGSSITQGGCASRPGMAYPAILSRKFNINHINLGFSGSAKGEELMAKFVSDLDMKIFVYDYDYNAPSAKHLQNTHENMFKIVRKKHPNLPIIILTNPFNIDERKKRQEIIYQTYINAVNNGDKNVYFISGDKLIETCSEEGSVDACHPTDLGFVSMAKALEEVLTTILDK